MSNFEKPIDILPKTKENYLQISWGSHLKFKDSLLFLKDPKGSSLCELVKDLDSDDLHILRSVFPNNYALLKRKGVFPYD